MVVDADNIICAVGEGWSAAAEQGNAAETLAQHQVVGKPLAQFIGNDTTRMYYDAVLKLCRLRGEAMSREYRCDSPTHQRFMSVTLTPLEEGKVEMRHTLLREYPFNFALKLACSGADKALPGRGVLRCSLCNRLYDREQELWQEPAQLVREQSLSLTVIHTVCPDCQATRWVPRTALHSGGKEGS